MIVVLVDVMKYNFFFSFKSILRNQNGAYYYEDISREKKNTRRMVDPLVPQAGDMDHGLDLSAMDRFFRKIW